MTTKSTNHTIVRRALLVAGAVSGLATPTWAVAEPDKDVAATAPAAAAAPNDADGVADVVITARYRAESAQKVPISLTSIAPAQLDRQGAFNLKQITEQLPGLNIQGISGRNQTITIRGIGTNSGGTNDGLAAAECSLYRPDR